MDWGVGPGGRGGLLGCRWVCSGGGGGGALGWAGCGACGVGDGMEEGEVQEEVEDGEVREADREW